MKCWSAQSRALSRMRISFLPNAVGRPLIERAAVLKKDRPRTPAKTEPNWAALEDMRTRSKSKKARRPITHARRRVNYLRCCD